MAVRENTAGILPYIGILFYISKILGITAFSFSGYYTKKVLQSSTIGAIWVGVSLIGFAGLYHVLTTRFLITDQAINTAGQDNTLTIVIGYFLVYLSPLMMAVDLAVGIFNQKKLTALFDRYKFVDERLLKENIIINNNKLKWRINILVVVVFVGELTLTSASFFSFFLNVDHAWLWYVSCLPLILNALEKIWFASFLLALKQRFEALNNYMDAMGSSQAKRKKAKEVDGEPSVWNLGYLQQEILLKHPALKRNSKIITVAPWDDTFKVKIEKDKPPEKPVSRVKDEFLDIMKMEVKLNNVCQLHDELCEIGKDVNSMWNLQMLLLMAYGFMSITAQFYFLYCSQALQQVPSLFTSAKSISISVTFIIYTAAKCVYLIFLSWQTKLESRKAGVCLHKISLAVDENNFYEIINHLSLKLLNHAVNFSACGFFDLDMSTLYAVTGAITSYLIILIQFNLAAHRTGLPTATTSSLFNETTSEMTLFNGTPLTMH